MIIDGSEILVAGSQTPRLSPVLNESSQLHLVGDVGALQTNMPRAMIPDALLRHGSINLLITKAVNLLPLLLRPLRLALSTQQLRHARIFLLKATHFPLVALILFYERALKLLDDRRRSGSPAVTPTLSLDSAASLRRPAYRKTPSNSRPSILARQPRDAQAPTRTPGQNQLPPIESMQGLSTAVTELRAQVEMLTDLLTQERQAKQS